MNKAFKTPRLQRKTIFQKQLERFKWLARQSSHYDIGAIVDLNHHPLRDEIIEKINNSEVVFS